MEAFFSNILSFPTLIFTGLLLFMCFYWLLAIAGLFDLDVLDLDIDLDADIDVTGFAGLMVTLGLTGVPFTVVLTILFLSSWAICFMVVHLFFFWGDNNLLNALIGSGVVIGSLALSIPITAALIRPLRPLFKALNNPEVKKVIVGKVCNVKSTRVDAKFGEATITIDGAELILKVRSDASHGLKKGDHAIIIENTDNSNIYWIEPTN